MIVSGSGMRKLAILDGVFGKSPRGSDMTYRLKVRRSWPGAFATEGEASAKVLGHTKLDVWEERRLICLDSSDAGEEEQQMSSDTEGGPGFCSADQTGL